MRMIDADILVEKIRNEARRGLDWKIANRMLDVINETPAITDVIPRPKKVKKTKEIEE